MIAWLSKVWPWAGFLRPIKRACVEAQSWPLKLRSCCKQSAFCQELYCDNEDVRIRKCDCLIRKHDCKENT
eukprot:11017380-Heterocapsa_arctica.AAC.1